MISATQSKITSPHKNHHRYKTPHATQFMATSKTTISPGRSPWFVIFSRPNPTTTIPILFHFSSWRNAMGIRPFCCWLVVLMPQIANFIYLPWRLKIFIVFSSAGLLQLVRGKVGVICDLSVESPTSSNFRLSSSLFSLLMFLIIRWAYLDTESKLVKLTRSAPLLEKLCRDFIFFVSRI